MSADLKNTVDVELILHGSPTWEQVKYAFSDDFEWFDEPYLVAGIKRHLLNESQRNSMHHASFSIEDMLNGRIEGAGRQHLANAIMQEWNWKLGHNHFGEV